ncbi:MAG: PorV/PorQ family protein [Gemmatimonadaceae bacterium]|nr:PorV/PorQ family protein [Gemmatimonadaceae bacterium]MDQ3517623.1 PorV/PorQ family protein [Gemmatimonadota bacterium]
MNRRLIALAAGGLMIIAAQPARAQGTGPGIGSPLVPTGEQTNSRVGTRGANFLEVGLGARAMGMAGAYSSLAEGLSGLYWNLAGTADVDNFAGGINYVELYGKDGLDYIWGGALLPIGGGVIGVQVGQMSSGDIRRTTFDFPDGGDPTVGDTYDFSGTMAELSYARRLTDRLNFGLGAKYATEGVSNAKANWYGIDVGLRFKTGLYGTTLGASLQNVGGSGRYSGNLITANSIDEFAPGLVRVNFRTENFEMPTVFRFSLMTDLLGGSEALLSQNASLGTLRAVGQFDQAIDTDLQGTIGLEYGWRNIAFLRGGKRWMNEADSGYQNFERGFAFGGGVRIPVGGRHMAFDYAWNGQGELPNTNHFSFEIGF